MIRIILISSVVPATYSAGHLVLYRHLVGEKEIDLHVMHTEPQKSGLMQSMRRLVCLLERLKFHRFYHDILALWRGRWIDAELPAPVDKDVPTVVMTVAHGDAYHAAMRYAEAHHLPLVSIYHDWWPNIPPIHGFFKDILKKSFRQLYTHSDLALCVSPQMRRALGKQSNAKVLYPMPSSSRVVDKGADRKKNDIFRVHYAGNLSGPGPMLISALEELRNHSGIRLEVRGASDSWPDSVRKEMTQSGTLLPYASEEQFDQWLRAADAYLITQCFEEDKKKLMQTNFPSKLLEFAKYGKPLIVWGPAYASGVIWARESGQALVVSEEDPEGLRNAIESLAINIEEQERLSTGAKKAAAGPFNPEYIQSNFLEWLGEVAG